MKQGLSPPLGDTADAAHRSVTPPRFEDLFVDMLGGGPAAGRGLRKHSASSPKTPADP